MELSERLANVLAAEHVAELSGGHQARVFRVTDRHGRQTIAKVLDASLVDRIEVAARVDVITALADLDPRVCRPLPLDGHPVTEVTVDDGHTGLIVCYEYAVGTPPDVTDEADAARMGRTLSELHVSMSRLAPTSLPPVAALRTEGTVGGGPLQLLHGDFNSSNLRQLHGATRIFDLEDCGCGPVAFDVANALYMVLFDSFVDREPEMYRSFKEAFLSGYCGAAGHGLDDDLLNRFIDVRIAALEAWLDDLTCAPIGIRTASPRWRAFLRSFVETKCDPTR